MIGGCLSRGRSLRRGMDCWVEIGRRGLMWESRGIERSGRRIERGVVGPCLEDWRIVS